MGGQTWELLLSLFSLIGFFVALYYLQKFLDQTRLGSEGWMLILIGIPLLVLFFFLIYFFVKELFWEGNLYSLFFLFVIVPYGLIFLIPLGEFREWLRQRKR